MCKFAIYSNHNTGANEEAQVLALHSIIEHVEIMSDVLEKYTERLEMVERLNGMCDELINRMGITTDELDACDSVLDFNDLRVHN